MLSNQKHAVINIASKDWSKFHKIVRVYVFFPAVSADHPLKKGTESCCTFHIKRLFYGLDKNDNNLIKNCPNF